MSDPHEALKRALLQAGKADAPPPGAKRELLDALGLGEEGVVSAQAEVSGVRRVVAADLRERPLLFGSVLERGGVFYRRLGVPAVVSIAVHAAVLALVLYGTTRAPTSHVRETEVSVHLNAPTVVARKDAPGGAPRGDIEPPKDPSSAQKKADGPVAVRAEGVKAEGSDILPGQPLDAPKVDSPSGATPGASAAAVSEKAVTGEVAAASPSAPEPFEKILPFGEGMNRPHRIEGPDPMVPREAREAKVEGTMLVKCIIATTGALRGCQILKSLPFMDEPVLAALARQRYTPVTFQGRPVNVEYVIPLKIELP